MNLFRNLLIVALLAATGLAQASEKVPTPLKTTANPQAKANTLEKMLIGTCVALAVIKTPQTFRYIRYNYFNPAGIVARHQGYVNKYKKELAWYEKCVRCNTPHNVNNPNDRFYDAYHDFKTEADKYRSKVKIAEAELNVAEVKFKIKEADLVKKKTQQINKRKQSHTCEF